MNNSEYDIRLIEKFVDNEISEEELTIVNKRLLTDTDFKLLYLQEKTIIEGIRLQGLQKDLLYLKDIEKSISAKKQTPNRFRWYYAAAASLICALGVWVYQSTSQSPEKLYLAYFKPYVSIEATTRSNINPTERTVAFQAYEQGDYKLAATLFKSLLAENKEPGILLLLGNANLMLDNTTEAKNNFITLYTEFDDYDIQAKWYLGLCYLKSGDVEKARTIWKELGETEISYAIKAKELLKKVD
ncbi:MAG: tetratricopeptide repeat protein [Cyclobacteriaceae bacterium]|nr:tetratricopeptide repeat protein [Cyclobacteriaceae bacterium]